MAFNVPDSSSYDNFRSTIYRCMAKQKLELTFKHGFFSGLLVMFLVWSGIIQTFFVSKEVFKLDNIYIDGRMYQLCRIK
jgi:hypothetical protein